MKKLLLLSSLVAILFTTACEGKKPDNPDNPDNPTAGGYVLSNVKTVIGGSAYDSVKVKFNSLDPVTVGEVSLFDVYEKNENTSHRQRTKSVVTDGVSTIKDIVIANGKMTANVVVKYLDEPEEIGTLEALLDNSGRATQLSIKYTDFASTAKLEYNAEGYLSKISEREVESDSDGMVTTFTYTNGNISKCSLLERYMTSDSEGNMVEKEETYDVVYSDYDTPNNGVVPHPFYIGSEDFMAPFFYLGIIGKPASKLPSKGIYSGSEIAYTYEKDANGNVSKITIVEDDNGEVYTEGYAFEYTKIEKK